MCLALTQKMKTQQMDRTIAPAAEAIARPNLPSTQKVSLTRDLDIHILNQGKQEVILFEMVIPVGRYQEPAPGLAYYLFKMLTEGTSKHSSEEIASTFDFYGSHLEVTPTLDHVSIKLYALSRFFPAVLDLLMEMLTDSVFPENEFDILQQIRVQQIHQQEARNNVYASLKFRELLFGEQHPYGRRVTPDVAQKTLLSEVIDFKSSLLAQPTLFITGRVTDKELNHLRTQFELIKFVQPTSSQSTTILPGNSLRINKDGSTQASIRLGKLSINRQHPDIHKFKIANELLGGFFGSRLMKNIREEKGLTYGIHSSALHLQNASYWYIGSEVLQDKTDLALSEITKEVQRLSNEAPSDSEFNMVTSYMKGKFLGSFDSPFSSHNTIKSLALDGLDEGYLYRYYDTLQSMRAEEISEMIHKHLNPESFTSLVVS